MPLQIIKLAAPAVAVNLCSSRKDKLGTPSKICYTFPIHLPLGRSWCSESSLCRSPASSLVVSARLWLRKEKAMVKAKPASSAATLSLRSPLRITVGVLL